MNDEAMRREVGSRAGLGRQLANLADIGDKPPRVQPGNGACDDGPATVLVDPETGFPVLTDVVEPPQVLAARAAAEDDAERDLRDLRRLAAGVATLLVAGACSAAIIFSNGLRHAATTGSERLAASHGSAINEPLARA